MDKLSAMQAFVEIVDQGSLTAAARSLERSQPAVVRTLARLERELGAPLLRRTTRRMSLTNEGRVYLEHCRRILSDVAAAEALVGQAHREPQGELRVTAPVLFGRMHVNPALIAFLERYPKVSVDLLLLDRVIDLVEEAVDLAVRIGPLPDSSMIATRVGSMRRVLCASPDFLAARGRPAHPRALTKLDCVRIRALGSRHWRFCTPPSASGRRREFSVSVDGRFHVNQVAAAVQACVRGVGVGSFLAYQVGPALAAGELELLLEDFELPPLPVSLVYADPRLLSPRLRALLDWMKDALRERDGSDRGLGVPSLNPLTQSE